MAIHLLDVEQFLGLRDTPDRPPPPPPRMILIRWGTRTVAFTEGCRSYPHNVDPLPGPAALLSDDRGELLSTRAAAAYCGYRDAAGIRKAKLDGLIEPASVGTNRAMYWRRSDLDDHNRRRGFVPGRLERGEDSGAAQPVGAAPMPLAEHPASSIQARPEVVSLAVEPIIAGSFAAPVWADVQPSIEGAAEGIPTTSAPRDYVAQVSVLADPLDEEDLAREVDEGPPVTATNDRAGNTGADLARGPTPSTVRWRSLAGVLGVVLAPRTIPVRPSEPDPTAATPAASARRVVPMLGRGASVPYRGTKLARDRRLASD